VCKGTAEKHGQREKEQKGQNNRRGSVTNGEKAVKSGEKNRF
jgi:hypothetical protein